MSTANRQLIGGQPYRYGYQGEFAETDPETGKPAFELRLYDPRINRWLTPDPYGQHYSPYLAMGNNGVNFVDPDGGWKTRFGAWLWKTFNGGGEIVGEKGNWSVAQQGADGWDVYVSNRVVSLGDNLSYSPLPGVTPTYEDMKGNSFDQLTVDIEFATPIKNPLTGNYGKGYSFGFTTVSEVNHPYKDESIRGVFTEKTALEPGIAFGISISFSSHENRINDPLTADRLRGLGYEVGGSIMIGGSASTDQIYFTREDGSIFKQKGTYNTYGFNIGLGIDSYTSWYTNTRLSGN